MATQARYRWARPRWACCTSATTTATSFLPARSASSTSNGTWRRSSTTTIPEKTSASRHPAHDNWCTVGDVGYLDEDGYLFLTDRKGFMIISGGVNIYPQEVENVLALHPKLSRRRGDRRAGSRDGRTGQGGRPTARRRHAVRRTGGRDHRLRTRPHARYKAPKSVDFIDELPRTATGKLVKRVLMDRYERGAPMSEFASRRYVVTGAASGIGNAVAELLLRPGRRSTASTATSRRQPLPATSRSICRIRAASMPRSNNSKGISTA